MREGDHPAWQGAEQSGETESRGDPRPGRSPCPGAREVRRRVRVLRLPVGCGGSTRKENDGREGQSAFAAAVFQPG